MSTELYRTGNLGRRIHFSDFFDRFSDLYIRDWKKRYTIFALVLTTGVFYAVIMDAVFHRQSDRVVFEFAGLVIFTMIAVPLCTIIKQVLVDPIDRSKMSIAASRPESSISASNDTTPWKTKVASDIRFKTLSPSAVSDGILGASVSEVTSSHDELALDALGKVLTETAKRLERLKEYEGKWRPMFLSIIKEVEDAYQDRQKAYKILLRLADKNAWSPWAVRCLPSLYDQVDTLTDGRVVAHVSQYVLGGVAPSYPFEVAEKLCNGEILRVVMPEETTREVLDIAHELEDCLRRNPNESDRAFIGTIITIWSQDEKTSSDARDSGTSQKLKVGREKILAEENVMTAEGL